MVRSTLSILILLFSIVKTAQNMDEKCIIYGETSIYLYGKLELTIRCIRNMRVVLIKLEFLNKNISPLIDLKNSYKEIPNYYNRYLLSYEKNVLKLIDIDTAIDNSVVCFDVFDEKKIYTYCSNPISIILEIEEAVSEQEKIDNHRFLHKVYEIDEQKMKIFCFDDFDRSSISKIIEILLCRKSLKYCYKFEFEKLKVSKIIYETSNNHFFISYECIYLEKYSNNIYEYTVGFSALIEKMTKVILTGRFVTKCPLSIIKADENFISWELNEHFLSKLVISMKMNINRYTIPIGECNKKDNKIVCNRYNGLRNIFGDFDESGLKIVKNFHKKYFFVINSDKPNNEGEDELFSSQIYIDTTMTSKKTIYEDIDESLLDEAIFSLQKKLLIETGILNFSLNYYPEINLNLIRFTFYTIGMGDKNYLVCINHGNSVDELPSVYSAYLLECGQFSISFYDFEKTIFNNKFVVLHVRINRDTVITFESEKILLKVKLFIPPKKAETQLNYKRLFHFEPILILGNENVFKLYFPKDVYYIHLMVLCDEKNTFVERITVNEEARVELKDSYISLSVGYIDFEGNLNSLEEVYVLFLITDGINFFAQGTKPIKIVEKTIFTATFKPPKITWTIFYEKFTFELYLREKTTLTRIGKCKSNKVCILYKNEYFQILKNDHGFLKSEIPKQSFEIWFGITPILNEEIPNINICKLLCDTKLRTCNNIKSYSKDGDVEFLNVAKVKTLFKITDQEEINVTRETLKVTSDKNTTLTKTKNIWIIVGLAISLILIILAMAILCIIRRYKIKKINFIMKTRLKNSEAFSEKVQENIKI